MTVTDCPLAVTGTNVPAGNAAKRHLRWPMRGSAAVCRTNSDANSSAMKNRPSLAFVISRRLHLHLEPLPLSGHSAAASIPPRMCRGLTSLTSRVAARIQFVAADKACARRDPLISNQRLMVGSPCRPAPVRTPSCPWVRRQQGLAGSRDRSGPERDVTCAISKCRTDCQSVNRRTDWQSILRKLNTLFVRGHFAARSAWTWCVDGRSLSLAFRGTV